MKIKGLPPILAVRAYGETKKPEPDHRPSVNKDSLQLSPEAKALQHLIKEAGEPLVRVDLVQDLKSRVWAGTYQVPVEALAAKIAEEIRGAKDSTGSLLQTKAEA
ncbi:MAG: flagellar biosynthesis anti-sigma factor FlgM [Bacillota bacterium]